ncbi:hypothetical protein [Nitratiruptor sp. SB155-2]|uniref:hypothetical protein n=1 Tax=Nitratiruptor sp. (strain SB155-2) TaxID=387092 RepID=UPI00015872F2|nr:hypothetical protein [Nitratiruptor sp. SB155-2]BAF69837.1 conserved hypothetical protein [Nitratiruptor sp. SB155-2]
MKQFFRIAFIVDLTVIIASFFIGNRYFLLNSQLAFISSLLVVLGSFYGYKKMIEKRVGTVTKDIIDDIEDRFDLYDEEQESIQDAKALFEEEKAKIKGAKKGLTNFLKTANGFFSPYRLFGYLFMVIAILVLIKHSMFDAWSFLMGLGVVPVSALIMALVPAKSR